MILCVPILLLIGIFIALKRELLGGIIIVASVFLFSLVTMIAEGFTFQMDFGLFALLGIMNIICGVADRRLIEE